MTNHPNRNRPVIDIRYFDGSTYVHERGQIVRSGDGYSPGPEYGVLYHLVDGRFLGGVRHKDHGDLMTDVTYADTARRAMPQRWR